jgi:molybdopterin/thiamine biosynthesis adenylyltransferase
LLAAYHDQFLVPWSAGKLDGDFAREPLSYWRIHVARAANRASDPVKAVWTADRCPLASRLVECPLLLPGGIVVVGDGGNNAVPGRIRESLGVRARQQMRVLVADVPITHALTPGTWPRSVEDLDHILEGRLSPGDWGRLRAPCNRRGRPLHRLVLLRNDSYGFAFLLPDGPPMPTWNKKRKRAYRPLRKPQPLNVVRVDAAWTAGRDQFAEVPVRQGRHVVVFGAGALGSSIVDQLAKAGVGKIDVVDPQDLETANLGRHLLGTDHVDSAKSFAVADRVNLAYPTCEVKPFSASAQSWLREHGLSGIDAVLDLTGEPIVRSCVDQARLRNPCPLLLGWMEPFVAAAHACMLPADVAWFQGAHDPMDDLNAVDWPDAVVIQEPGCSSRFHSYTAAAATHAVALVAEQAIKLIDGPESAPRVLSWVRGQHYLDDHWSNLRLRAWAEQAAAYDGLVLERAFPVG